MPTAPLFPEIVVERGPYDEFCDALELLRAVRDVLRRANDAGMDLPRADDVSRDMTSGHYRHLVEVAQRIVTLGPSWDWLLDFYKECDRASGD